MSEEKIKAIYYPYTIMPERLLKQTILYFDEITVCLPYYFDIPEEYKFLHENSLINIFKKPLDLNKFPQGVPEFQDFQLKTQNFLQVYRKNEEELRGLHKFQEREMSRKAQVIRQERQKLQQRLEQGLDEFWHEIDLVLGSQQQALRQLFYREYLLPHEACISNNFLIDQRVSAHFELFETSYNKGQFPFTDNHVAQAAFIKTFQSNIEKKENKAVLAEVLRAHKTGFLVKEIFKNHLEPLPALEIKSFEDILELKDRLKDNLEDFKTDMRGLAHDIKNNPWEDGFEGQLLQIVDQKINPKIRELGKRKKNDPLVSKLLKLGGPTASVIMGLNAITNISTSLSLGIAGLGIGAPILGEWLEARANKQSEYNGLNLLVELKDELKK